MKSVLLASVLLTLPLASYAADEKAPRTPESAVTPGRENLKRHAIFLDRIKAGPVGLLFLGDSITDFWPKIGENSWLRFAPYNPADFGISGECTEQVLWRILNGELEGIQPKVVVIMIGTNNIGHFKDEKPEWVAAGITKIVETVRAKLPESKILLLAIFPRATKDSPDRARVAEVNKIIAKLDNGSSIRYLDIGPKFLDAQGELPADVMPDKLHPNAKGYEIWYAAMNPTLQEMLK